MSVVKRPLAFFALCFAVGILFLRFHPAAVVIPLVFLPVIFILLKESRVVVLVAAAALLAGFFHTFIYYYKNTAEAEKWLQSADYFIARVVSEPKLNDLGKSVTAESGNVKLRLLYDKERLSYGDIVLVKSSDVRESNDSLKTDGIFLSVLADSVKVLDNKVNYFNPRELAFILRSRFIHASDRLWKRETLMLAKGMLFGENSFSDDFYEKLAQGSIAHIVAVSGLHVSFLGALVLFLLKRITRRRYFSLLCLPVVWFFVLLTGAAPSAERAAVMFSLYILSEELFKPYDPLSAMGAAALFILIKNPLSLFSLSFIMSFAAVLGIILFAPAINKLLSFLPDRAAELFSLSVACQAFIFPITAVRFGRIALLSLLANLFVIPFVPVMIISGYGAAISEVLGLKASGIFAEIFRFFSGFSLKTASVFGGIPFSNIKIRVFNIAVFSGFVIFFLGFLYFALIKRHAAVGFLSVNISLVFLASLIILTNTQPREGIYITSGAAVIADKESVLMVADSYDIKYYGDEIYSFLKEKKIFNVDALVFTNDAPDSEEIKDFMRNFNVRFSGSLSEGGSLKTGKISLKALYGTDGTARIYEIGTVGKTFIASGKGAEALLEKYSGGGVFLMTESEFKQKGLNPDIIFYEKTSKEHWSYKILKDESILMPEDL